VYATFSQSAKTSAGIFQKERKQFFLYVEKRYFQNKIFEKQSQVKQYSQRVTTAPSGVFST